MGSHNIYLKLIDEDRGAVDEAFRAVVRTLRAGWYDVAFDDRAERLVEAIAVFMMESCDGRIDESGKVARP